MIVFSALLRNCGDVRSGYDRISGINTRVSGERMFVIIWKWNTLSLLKKCLIIRISIFSRFFRLGRQRHRSILPAEDEQRRLDNMPTNWKLNDVIDITWPTIWKRRLSVAFTTEWRHCSMSFDCLLFLTRPYLLNWSFKVCFATNVVLLLCCIWYYITIYLIINWEDLLICVVFFMWNNEKVFPWILSSI